MSEKNTFDQFRSSLAFKYCGLIFSIYLIILASMSIYEGQLNSSEDTSTNVGLLVISVITLVLCAAFLIGLIYLTKMDPLLTFTEIYVVFTAIAFGIIVGTIATVCALDVPNVDYRSKLLWSIGIVLLLTALIGVIVCSVLIAKSYGVQLPKVTIK